MITDKEYIIVQRFEQRMKEILDQKAKEKESWASPRIKIEWLEHKLLEEIGEVLVIRYTDKVIPEEEYRDFKYQNELIDIANLCMMIWTKIEGIA